MYSVLNFLKDFNNSVLPFIFICLTIGLDSFFSSVSYKASGIKMPISSCIIISFVGALCFGIPLVFGNIIAAYLTERTADLICFLLLTFLGMFQIFSGCFKDKIKLKKSVKRTEKSEDKKAKKISFKLFNLRFILQIYADTADADMDKSKKLSPFEALFLALALSLDSIAVGFGSSFGAQKEYIFFYVIICFIINLALIFLGVLLGKWIEKFIKRDLSWTAGLVLIIIGILKWF